MPIFRWTMLHAATHFAVGAVVSGALAVLFSWLAGERLGSVVMLPVVVGVVCAAAAHALGSWATAAVLLVIAATMWRESRTG
ncbi:MAG: hypothetical protein U0842_24900 [Candidatus Binatia bacterium]